MQTYLNLSPDQFKHDEEDDNDENDDANVLTDGDADSVRSGVAGAGVAVAGACANSDSSSDALDDDVFETEATPHTAVPGHPRRSDSQYGSMTQSTSESSVDKQFSASGGAGHSANSRDNNNYLEPRASTSLPRCDVTLPKSGARTGVNGVRYKPSVKFMKATRASSSSKSGGGGKHLLRHEAQCHSSKQCDSDASSSDVGASCDDVTSRDDDDDLTSHGSDTDTNSQLEQVFSTGERRMMTPVVPRVHNVCRTKSLPPPPPPKPDMASMTSPNTTALTLPRPAIDHCSIPAAGPTRVPPSHMLEHVNHNTSTSASSSPATTPTAPLVAGYHSSSPPPYRYNSKQDCVAIPMRDDADADDVGDGSDQETPLLAGDVGRDVSSKTTDVAVCRCSSNAEAASPLYDTGSAQPLLFSSSSKDMAKCDVCKRSDGPSHRLAMTSEPPAAARTDDYNELPRMMQRRQQASSQPSQVHVMYSSDNAECVVMTGRRHPELQLL